MIKSIRRPSSPGEMLAALRVLALDAWGAGSRFADGLEANSVIVLKLSERLQLALEVVTAARRDAERRQAEADEEDLDALRAEVERLRAELARRDAGGDHEPGPGTIPPGSKLSLN